MDDPAFAAAQTLAAALASTRRRIVFAESCTAGLVSATLGRIADISKWHCGSAVVYRLDTKHRWLGITAAMLHSPGPVSREVACAMATGVLERTPEADFAVSITGHLGPNAPAEQDGLIWFAAVQRLPQNIVVLDAHSTRLPGNAEGDFTVRETRQRAATQIVLEFATRCIR